MASHTSKNTSPHHLTTFYKTFNQVKNESFDGMIITGAPVEQLDFEEVDYWGELCEIMEWSKHNVCQHSTSAGALRQVFIYHYGIKKHLFTRKN